MDYVKKGVIVQYKKRISYVLVFALCILSFAGCKRKSDKLNNASIEVFRINHDKIYLDEVLYQVWHSEDDNAYYSKDFEQKYKSSYWNSEIVKGKTVRESLKEQLYDEMVRDALLYQKAVEEGYKLSADEEKINKEEANAEWNAMSKKVRETIGCEKERIVSFKKKKALIDKYFSEILDSYKVDEKEIRDSINSKTYEEIDIQTIGYYKYSYDENGVETEKTKEENEVGLKCLQSIEDKAKKADSLLDILKDDSEPLETEELCIIPGETACDKAIEEVAKAMQPGETSDILETDSGYFIVKVLNNSSDDAYEEAVEHAVKQEKYKQFDAYYDTIKKEADIQETKEWDSIVIGGTVLKES